MCESTHWSIKPAHCWKDVIHSGGKFTCLVYEKDNYGISGKNGTAKETVFSLFYQYQATTSLPQCCFTSWLMCVCERFHLSLKQMMSNCRVFSARCVAFVDRWSTVWYRNVQQQQKEFLSCVRNQKKSTSSSHFVTPTGIKIEFSADFCWIQTMRN